MNKFWADFLTIWGFATGVTGYILALMAHQRISKLADKGGKS
jgi:hypothetical protein